jgi:hypothetical protein
MRLTACVNRVVNTTAMEVVMQRDRAGLLGGSAEHSAYALVFVPHPATHFGAQAALPGSNSVCCCSMKLQRRCMSALGSCISSRVC